MGDHIQALCGTSQAMNLLLSQKTYSNTQLICSVVQQLATGVQSILSNLESPDANRLTKFSKTPLREAPLPDSNPIRAAAFRRGALSTEEGADLDVALARMDAKTTAEEVKASPLLRAAQLRRHDLVRALLAFGAYPNLSARYPEEKPEDLEMHPIHFAAVNGDAITASLLLRSGADINALTSSKRTALELASCRGSDGLDVIHLLLSNNSEQNVLGCPYSTALQSAIHLGESDAVFALLEAGADPNRSPAEVDLGAASDVDTLDSPPLHSALGYCAKYPRDMARVKIVESLMKHGADTTVIFDPSTKHIKEDLNALAWLSGPVPQSGLRS